MAVFFPLSLSTFSSKLKQNDTKKRTFFAAMLGDAIQQGNTSTSKEALFDEYYRRSYEHSWKNPPIDDAHYYFLGLTSIGVAINPKRLQSYQALDLFPKINDINQQLMASPSMAAKKVLFLMSICLSLLLKVGKSGNFDESLINCLAMAVYCHILMKKHARISAKSECYY
jgi:hypothetical protein